MEELKEPVTVQSVGRNPQGEAEPVLVNVQISEGVGIQCVGLPDAHAYEMVIRVVGAIQTLGYSLPGKKIAVTLSSSSGQCKGSGYDLPVAIGILVATGQIERTERIGDILLRCVFSGELGLDGSLRVGEGLDYQGYAMAIACTEFLGEQPKCLVTCNDSAIQALVAMVTYPYGFNHLSPLIDVLKGNRPATPWLASYLPDWKAIGKDADNMKDLIFGLL